MAIVTTYPATLAYLNEGRFGRLMGAAIPNHVIAGMEISSVVVGGERRVRIATGSAWVNGRVVELDVTVDSAAVTAPGSGETHGNAYLELTGVSADNIVTGSAPVQLTLVNAYQNTAAEDGRNRVFVGLWAITAANALTVFSFPMPAPGTPGRIMAGLRANTGQFSTWIFDGTRYQLDLPVQDRVLDSFSCSTEQIDNDVAGFPVSGIPVPAVGTWRFGTRVFCTTSGASPADWEFGFLFQEKGVQTFTGVAGKNLIGTDKKILFATDKTFTAQADGPSFKTPLIASVRSRIRKAAALAPTFTLAVDTTSQEAAGQPFFASVLLGRLV